MRENVKGILGGVLLFLFLYILFNPNNRIRRDVVVISPRNRRRRGHRWRWHGRPGFRHHRRWR